MTVPSVPNRRISKRILDIENALTTVKTALEANELVTATVYLAMIQRESSGMLLDMWLLEELGDQIAAPILEDLKKYNDSNAYPFS